MQLVEAYAAGAAVTITFPQAGASYDFPDPDGGLISTFTRLVAFPNFLHMALHGLIVMVLLTTSTSSQQLPPLAVTFYQLCLLTPMDFYRGPRWLHLLLPDALLFFSPPREQALKLDCQLEVSLNPLQRRSLRVTQTETVPDRDTARSRIDKCV